jgi:hypothetical protein
MFGADVKVQAVLSTGAVASWPNAPSMPAEVDRLVSCCDAMAPAEPGQSADEVRVWQGTSIERRAEDGFVNATAMCKVYGKRWENYHRNERTQQYVAALAKSVFAGALQGSARNRADLVITITTGPNELRGTWVHPRIAVDLARWLHPEFAVWMDCWFLEATGRR